MGVQIPTREGHFWGQKGGDAGHAQTCLSVDILRHSAGETPVRCGCRLGCTRWGHIGTTWWIRLNQLCAVAMRPYVKLLWPLVVFDIAAKLFTKSLFYLYHTEYGSLWLVICFRLFVVRILFRHFFGGDFFPKTLETPNFKSLYDGLLTPDSCDNVNGNYMYYCT